jgi:ABC-2 type transport system ATP-binding protein
MSEMELTAEHLIVIGRGHILADVSMEGFHRHVVPAQDRGRLSGRHSAAGPAGRPDASITSTEPSRLEIEGIGSQQVGEMAATHGVVLHQLTDVAPSLEEAFMELTADSVVFHGSVAHEGRSAA